MLLYRIARTLYINDLSGSGARMHGGRWNSEGTSMLYFSSGIALCALEMACNSGGLIGLTNMSACCIEIPENIRIYKPSVKELPAGWDSYPSPVQNARMGDNWIRAQTALVMRVPSAIIPDEYNFLINPVHPEFAKSVRIRWVKPFTFDPRLFPLHD